MADAERNRNSKKPAGKATAMWPLRHIKARPRLTASVVLAIAVFLLLPPAVSVQTRILAAFDFGAALYLFLVFPLITRATPDQVRRRARIEDEGRWAVLIFAAAASATCLVAIGFELHAARQSTGGVAGISLAFAGITILLAWLFVHTSFAIHYAHEYYGDVKADRSGHASGDKTRGGLTFPEEDCPDYWDFLYFSFVLGATCQVSDVQVTNRMMRRLVLGHGVMAFVFNTLILALAINIAASAF